MRTRSIRSAAVCLASLALITCWSPSVQAALDPAVEQRVDALLAKMTIEEKVGQLHQLARQASGLPREDVKAGRIGSLLNVIDPKEAAELQGLARRSPHGIPLILGYDVIHGFRTVFPSPLGEAATFDPGIAERDAEIAAREASAQGLHWTFAPMVDIARDPRWGRIMEGAGEDPYLGSLFAAARVRGFRRGGLAACAKHYVGYGAALGGRDYNDTDISESTLRDVYLPPFLAAKEAGAETFMSAFNDLNGIPASANRHTLRDILKKEWGFEGFVVSDWNSIGELISHGVAKDKAEATKAGIVAGVDMDMEGRCYSETLAGLVKAGQVPVALLDDAVRRVLRVKVSLGLFERKDPDPVAAAAALLTDANKRAAREAARDAIVLLKNEHDLLPLGPGVRSIAVVGPLADSGADQLGFWAGDGKGADAITVLAGIRERAGSAAKVSYAKGCEITAEGSDGFAEAVRLAREADVVVAVLGESQEWSGEAASRAHIGLPGVQQQLLEALVAAGKPVALVLVHARPLALPWAGAHVPAMLTAWFPGTMGGPALADILFGDVSPSGKLPVTFPRALGQVPIFYGARPGGRPANPTRFSSKYVDEAVDPLFPFGHGLSYTRFEYSGLEIAPAKVGKDGSVEVSVTVKNAGARAGKEVAQLYVRDPVASRSRPLRELKGFSKLALGPGEQKKVTFTVKAGDLGFHDDAGAYAVEAGEFQVFVGGSSLADLRGAFTVESR
jgi:beta-glucosidase